MRTISEDFVVEQLGSRVFRISQDGDAVVVEVAPDGSIRRFIDAGGLPDHRARDLASHLRSMMRAGLVPWKHEAAHAVPGRARGGVPEASGEGGSA